MFRHISRKVLPVLFIMIALPVLTDSLEAQEGQTTKSNVFTLGEIEVKDKAEENKNITVEKIDKDKMQEFNRDRVSDALNLLPGITVSNTGNRNDSNVYVRGFDIRRTPVFLDGIPIYVPYDRTFDYNRFTTFDLSEIVVSKGFTSVLYGPNTMGGAINLVTLKPQKPFEGSVGAQYGTGNTYYGYANVGTNQKLWYMQAGTSYFNRDYFPMSGNFTSTSRQGDGRRINSYSRDDKIEFRFGLTPAEGHEYAFTYIKQHGEKGQPPDVRSNFSTQYWQWPKWDKESYYLSTSTPIGSKSYVKSRLYYDKFENLLDYFTDITYSKPQRTSNMGERSYYDDYTVGGSLEAGTTLIPKNNIKASFHYKRDSHSDRNRVYTLGSGNSAKTVYPPWAQDDNATISAGLEDTIDFTKNFYGIAGISYDRMEGLRANKWVYNGTNTTPIKHNFDTTTSNSWNPQIGFFYLISDTGKLHASIEKKTRFPTMKEKYSWGLPSSGKQTIENPNLKPEESINYEVGYEDLFFKDLRFKVALFHNDISDAIESVTFREGGTQYTQNQNISKVKQYGIETGVTYSFFDFLETGFNYTYLDRRNKARDLTVGGYKLTSVPVHKFFSYARYATPLKGLSVLGSLEYNTKRYSTTDGASASIARAFSVVNTKAMYKMNKVDGLTVEAGINNLFDRNYELVAGYPEPGRTYFMGMRYNF